MKKIIPVLLITCICFALGGCSDSKEKPDIHGREQIENLRSEAAGWESGRYLFTDLQTGETNQVFSFMYNADGSQTCLYEQVTDGNYHAEYYGGGMIYILDGGNISVLSEGSPDYVSYSRENPHPYSTGELMFYVEEYIDVSDEVYSEQNTVTYKHQYDTYKMNRAIGTSLTDFDVTYTFDSEGNFLYFTQSSFNGADDHHYMIETLDVNSVTEIENPALSR